VCGPGVAITSCVPPNNFAAWDGTSMATPHITGLAALTLAHHPDFQTPQYQLRGAERVERLFQIIRASARRVSLGDQSRTGFGLPDVLVAVGLQTPAGQALPQQPAVAPQSNTMGQAAIGAMMAPQAMLSPFMAGAMEPFGLELARAPWNIPRTAPWYQISPTVPPQYPTFRW